MCMLDCFLFDITNNATVNMGVQVSLIETLLSIILGVYQEVELLE